MRLKKKPKKHQNSVFNLESNHFFLLSTEMSYLCSATECEFSEATQMFSPWNPPCIAHESNREFPVQHGFLFPCNTDSMFRGAAGGKWGYELITSKHPQTPTLLSQRHCFCLNQWEQVILTQPGGDQNKPPANLFLMSLSSSVSICPPRQTICV